MTSALVQPMAKQDSMPVRLSLDAIELAKKAAALKGMTLADYASRVLLDASMRDLDQWAHARVKTPKKGD